MKRLIAVLTILAFVGTWAVVPIASAKVTDPRKFGQLEDPGRPSALEGSYITGNGQFQWLMIAAPGNCLDKSDNCPDNEAHLWFYNEACNRLVDKPAPLTENDVRVFPLHSTSFLTAPRIGNVLVAAVSRWRGSGQPVLATSAVIGEMFYIDVNRGIGRMEELARLGSSGGLAPYDGSHVIAWAPPDDGTNFFVTLLVRCPVGGSVNSAGTVFGTPATLAGDLIELMSQENGGSIGDGYASTLSNVTRANFNGEMANSVALNDVSGRFASFIQGFVYNVDEEFQESVDRVPCRCIGVTPPGGSSFVPEVRLSALSAFAAANESYWELDSFNTNPGESTFNDAWTAALNIQLKVGSALNVNFFGRLHHARGRLALEP
jgi:hypothetical protein